MELLPLCPVSRAVMKYMDWCFLGISVAPWARGMVGLSDLDEIGVE